MRFGPFCLCPHPSLSGIRVTASLLRADITNVNEVTVVNGGFYASFVYTLLWKFVIVVGENEDV